MFQSHLSGTTQASQHLPVSHLVFDPDCANSQEILVRQHPCENGIRTQSQTAIMQVTTCNCTHVQVNVKAFFATVETRMSRTLPRARRTSLAQSKLRQFAAASWSFFISQVHCTRRSSSVQCQRPREVLCTELRSWTNTSSSAMCQYAWHTSIRLPALGTDSWPLLH